MSTTCRLPLSSKAGQSRFSPRGERSRGEPSDDALVDVAPLPRLARLQRSHDGVAAFGGVLAGVLVLRRIAAADLAAREAEPQVHPGVAHAHALAAGQVVGRHDLDLVEVLANDGHRLQR